jgi:hypothetical protein
VRSPALARASEWVAHAALALLCGALLARVGQPIITDDLWWHLGLGEAFAQHGPWLSEDPLLFTAPGPPDTASWLADVALYTVWRHTGFAGLRVLHAAWVASILALAWSLLRRASRSRAAASAGTLAFAALGAYRLVQLRPELFSILATLALYRLLCEPESAPTWRRIGAAALLFALWANCHAGFPLGLALLAASAAALAAEAIFRPTGARGPRLARTARLGVAAVACALASLANPSGVGALLVWFQPGTDLAIVADEWARFQPLHLPVANLPPTPLAFALVWALLALAPLGLYRALRRAPAPDVEPVLLTWALASLGALLVAVRFLWLGLFPLLAIARSRKASPVAAAAWSVLLLPAFFLFGDWRMIPGSLPQTLADYAQPYPADRYYAHPIWFLVDAGLEGHVFTDYALGGFTGFFGAPRLRTFVNGSLNVTNDAIDANLPIRERRGARPGEDFLALLDRMQIDLFVGTRLPEIGPPNRPWFYTTAHLEGAPGWICVFRNIDSAVYLRDNPRNAANRERVAAYYARERVPYDPKSGFDVLRVLRGAPRFAIEHGLAPVQFDDLAAAAHHGPADARGVASARLAMLYLSLGLYDDAIRLDRAALASTPSAVAPRRRAVWCLLRLGRLEEAREEAAALAQASPGDPLSRLIAETAREAARESDPERRAVRIAALPALTRSEASAVLAGVALPEPRPRPPQGATDLQTGSSASATPSLTLAGSASRSR